MAGEFVGCVLDRLGIESELDCVFDVDVRDDGSRLRGKDARVNLVVSRRVAVSLLRRAPSEAK